MNSFRAGMQVHAVPDDERATDANGKSLPWAYAYADSSLNRKQPVERGPFGRPTARRASSRTKTVTPGPREDPVVAENMKTFDEIFGRTRKELEEYKAPSNQRPAASTRLPQAQSAMDLTQSTATAAPVGQSTAFKEPTEVLIYGYGADHQAHAIAHFEQVSGGRIYEDYDRNTSEARYNHLFSSNNIRASIPRSLPKEAIRKINTYQGGDHWIKVTFDSPAAAEMATYASPHVVDGYEVYAEVWRGTGPNEDAPIPAGTSQANTPAAQRRPTQPAQRRPFASMPSRIQSAPSFAQPGQQDNGSPQSSATASSDTAVAATSGADLQTTQQQQQQASQGSQNSALATPQKPLRIRGATRVALRPAAEALLPVAPWSQRTFGHIPLVGSLFGGDPMAKPGQGGGIIGTAVPRKDDGAFDWEGASLYWRVCWLIDAWAGTDLCGMRGED